MRRNDVIKVIPAALACILFCICLFTRTQQCVQGVRDGLRLCAATVIPSLFPFLAVSRFIAESGLAELTGKLFSKPTRLIFGLSGISAPVILTSLIGGYPVGAKMTESLLMRQKISPSEAQRLNTFCVNAGPAFIIGTVGSLMFHSVRAGVILYVSTTLSSLIFGILTRFFKQGSDCSDNCESVIFIGNPAQALSSAVSGAVNSMLSICAWIVLFSTVIGVIISVNASTGTTVLCSVMEVTVGVKLSVKQFSLPIIAAIISFGGLCVHCQILPSILASGIKLRLFFASRAVCSAISAIICKALLTVFPCEISVFSDLSQVSVDAFSISLPCAATVIIMCALLIFEVDTNKKMC